MLKPPSNGSKLSVGSGERIYYLDILRIIATVAVILTHVSARHYKTISVFSLDWQVLNFFDAISRFAVPIFVMISGAIFLDNAKNITVRKIWTKYIPRIVIAFLVWSLIYAFFACEGSLSTFIYATFHGHYHMWFLFMIAGLYAVTPLLRKITADANMTKYFLLLAFIVAIIVPDISAVLLKISPHLPVNLSRLFENAIDDANITLVAGYAGYYVLGYYLKNRSFTQRQYQCLAWLGLIGFASTIALNSLFSLHANTAQGFFYGNFRLEVLLQALGIYAFVRAYSESSTLSERSIRRINLLSTCSFGIYLVHALVLELITKYYEPAGTSTNQIIKIPLLVLIVAIISFIISWLIHKLLPKLSKYIA